MSLNLGHNISFLSHKLVLLIKQYNLVNLDNTMYVELELIMSLCFKTIVN